MFTTFGDLLRFLRRHKGMTQLELSFQVGYSHAQISRLEQNLRLPDIPTLEARFIPALGLLGEPKAVERLLELAAQIRREDAPAPGLCPYKGLNYFDEADADLFVGREALTAELVERVHCLASNSQPAQERFLAIVGASGSGKSSLARAGLVPALHWNQISADWDIYVFTPTAHPLESLAVGLAWEAEAVSVTGTLIDDLAGDSRSLQIYANHRLQTENNSHLLLVVDQFEELFALCRSEEERVSFIDNLLSASSQPEGPVIVVITLRADFYAHCANYDQLRAALARNQEYIGAMSAEELRRAIEEPAQRGRWEFESGLVDLLLHDVGADVGHTPEPGALPLLSHAMLETWQRRRGRTMTLSGYASSGGVRGAIAETAEAVFSDQFTNQQQSIARRIFLRLTELGDEPSTADTRRRATFKELILRPEETETTQAVLKALADARLITTSQDSVEVAHEALIREWPTLRGWLEENRESLRLHRHLTEAAQEWISLKREPDVLYRGARLAQVREWASAHENEMNALEREFLFASIDASEREAAERELQRQRELEAARKLAEAEKHRAEQQTRTAGQLRRRAMYLIGVLALAVIAALTAGIFANRNGINLTRSEAQRLAAEANNLMLSNGDPNLIALLSIRSLNTQYTLYGDAILADITTLEPPPRELRGHKGAVNGIAFSPDGRYLATGSSDKTALLWDLASGETVQVFSGHTDEVGEVVFSPDGKYLATTSMDRTARLWDVASGETVQTFSGQPSGLVSVAFSPNGKSIVTDGFVDHNGRLWDVATGQTLHILRGHSAPVVRVAYSPDGKYVLTGGIDKTARLWDAVTGDEVQVFMMPSDTESVTFSPDGKTVAIGNSDHVARLWDITTGQMMGELSGHQGLVMAIRFSPDGRTLLTGSADRTARLWDLATGQTTRIFGGHAASVQSVTFSPDGRLVATASYDGIARVWNLQTSPIGIQFIGTSGEVYQASFSPDGEQVVTASQDGDARIWNTATGQTVLTLAGQTSNEEVRSAIFSPDGRMVLIASRDGTAKLWDASSGEELRRFEGHTNWVGQAVFSPGGKYVVTTSYDGTARVWDAQTGQTIVTYTDQGPDHVNRVAFSPDGKTVVTSGDDGTARIWDPSSGEEQMVFKGHTDIVEGVAFSPDGKYLVTSSFDGSVRMWEVSSGREVRRFAGHPGGALGAAFSPDGKTLLTSGVDGTARLWDMQTGQEVRRFTGHGNWVRNAVFSPDGKYILTSSDDNTARLWLADLHDTLRAVCALLTRDLTPEERAQYGIIDQEPTCQAL
jgi:WD40 repeat protein/transcriptional regulator with XRE-family HTH domain